MDIQLLVPQTVKNFAYKQKIANLPIYWIPVKSYKNACFIYLRKLCNYIKQVFLYKNIDMKKKQVCKHMYLTK